MSTFIIDDRPLKPQKQYIQQKQKLYQQQKKQKHDYLKKHQLHDKVLPCFRDHLLNKHEQKFKFKNEKQNYGLKNNQHSKEKSKAEIYKEIKKKNLEKFGQRKKEEFKNNDETKNQIKNKKINPKNMTVNYKPKTPHIDTNQNKLSQKHPQFYLSASQRKPQNSQSPSSYPHTNQTAKQKYQKLLQILRQEKFQFNKQKVDFEKHKQKLEFKKLIETQNSVPFIEQIKRKMIKQKILQSRKRGCQVDEKNIQKQTNNKQKRHLSQQKQYQSTPNQQQTLANLHTKISYLKQQKQDLQYDIVKNHSYRAYVDQTNVVCTKYSITSINQIPNFDIECFKEFIDFKTLTYEGNQNYHMAKKVFEMGLNAKQIKKGLQIENISKQIQNGMKNLEQKNEKSELSFKRRYQGSTRITKYDNGWIQVWLPGSQRVMSCSQLHYKITWLHNGDIHQQFKDKKLSLYYSKDKQLTKISYLNYQPIYYFLKLQQLQQLTVDKKNKIVMFKDGRIEMFTTQQDKMNGFAV